ncbi:S-layer homology domain-containing protein [Paenibacillus oryzisoli]|uniref:SLH domain-containing protein n=1 Tax=Paenibacillus oryzisoli TaxID=1850517 RepID=A0A197ZZA2_9BACL|nr:S-layer homology domain-containing protein [Paenibacillus oryzisoli]OAS14275.1 hypothetical protein A8708_12790 [Paenibacillus oryzisoli]
MQRIRQNRNKKTANGILMKSILVIAIVLQLFGLTGNQSAQASSIWSSLGTGLSGTYARTMAVSGTDLYVGGSFTTAGGTPASHIAKWDGSQWSSLGTGLNSYVFAIAASGADVYAGGIFSTAGGTPVGSIAKWNGSNWSNLGTGTNGSVYAIAVSGTDVYAAGNFSTAGGVPATNIAKWNGTSWSSLGTGLNNTVYALAVSGSNVYAAGSFSTAGGTAAVRIAKWDGTSWSSLGAGLNGDAFALALSGTDVYVGGNFTTAGGSSANRLAKWNGSTWSSLGTGLDNTVSAIAVSGNNIYAGGGFTTAGGGSANRIAKWDGSSWSSLGSGVNNSVNAITVWESAIYTGGFFTTAGGNTADLIAKWGDSAPTITFNSNGGSAVSSQSVVSGGIATEPTPPPTKVGHTFAGWYSESGLSTIYNFASPVVADLTLHAKWTVITATPVITGTVRAGDTSVTGTAAAGATIILSVNGTPSTPVTASGGNWTVSGLTLASGDTISVTAQSAGETESAATTATVVPAAKNITAFDAIGDVAAGTAGAATYANAGEVTAALLASHAAVTADSGTIAVPVTAWVDTDSYNASVAGSYTFTATLGSLPANTTNTGGFTATVEVVVAPVITNITAFDAISDVAAGTAGSAAYVNAGEVTAALLASHANVMADGGTIAVPVTAWVDTDGYNASVAGSYSFTATLGSLPVNTTNTNGLTATVEVVVSPVITNITAFDAIGDVAAGTAGAATYGNAGEVAAALLASHASVMADGGTIAVPVTSWVDTDGYNASIAGSYTFTATLGSLPVNTTNTSGVTATIKVVVSPVITNITAFDAIGDVAAGTAGVAAYANAGEVAAALLASHANVMADGGTIAVPVTSWVDTDGYNASVAGSYSFTATLGSLPANTTNTNGLTATIEVVVSPVITNITAFDAITDVAAGTAGAAAYANAGEVKAALLASHASVTADGSTIAVPVTAWVDTDGYNASVAGSYTFTATLGSLPVNTTNTNGVTATVEVVVSPVITNITAFDAITDVAAGTAGAATYANAGEVTAAFLASHANVMANGGTIAVPVTSWVDTDGYNASVAGSYTFTATLGSLPVNTTNTNGVTATIEVVVTPVITNITAFDAIGDLAAGTAGAAAYANAGEVAAGLLASHATVTADGGTIAVPVTAWTDTDSYKASVAGSYTFTATLGSLPTNTINTNSLTATVEVVVSPIITNIIAFDAIGDVAAGTAGSATYANAGEVTAALLTSHASVTANGTTITVPVTAWTDTDSYNASVAGSYTFTAMLGSLPANTTNTSGLTATVKVVISPVITSITAFDAIGDISAGTVGSATYANAVAVTTALLASHATVTANGTTITVPVTAWLDTDSYNASIAGSYTFTATLGSLPANTTNTSGLTATVEVVIASQLPSTGGSEGGGNSTSPITTDNPVTSTDGTLTLPVGRRGIVSLENEVIVSIPADSTDKLLQLTITKVLETQQLLTNKNTLASPIFEILKNFAENFNKQVTLTFAFDRAKLGGNQTVAVRYFDEVKKEWVEVPGGKINEDRIAVEVDHFTKYGVFIVTQEATGLGTDTNSTKNLTDIAGHWAEANIKQAIRGGIVVGYPNGTFAPNQTVTREEFAVMAVNALQKQGEGVTLPFTDTANIGNWALQAVAQAVQSGLIQGYEDDTFRPNAQIARSEMAVIIAKAMGQSIPSTITITTGFADDKNIPTWAIASVAYLKQTGVMQGGNDHLFAPQAYATRAEAVTVLLNMLAYKSK